MPNRRRRKLSTAMSAVAALAVASPFAVVGVMELTAGPQQAPEHRDFVQAAVVTDLPNELLSALQQGLSQFGINLPPLPTGLSPAGAQPVQAGPALTTPSLTAPGLTTPSLTAPGLTTPGLTSPQVGAGGLTPSTGIGLPSEQPISAPLGPVAGTYPILGDPSLAVPSAPASGGIISDLSSAANQLGVGQAIDLLKGVVMPSITQAIQGASSAAAAAPAAAG